MYRNSESYSVVKKILMESVPHTKILKLREEGETLIVVTLNMETFFLNEVAKDFIKLCDGKRRLIEIIENLGEIYDVEKNILTDDLMEITRDYQYKRILHMEVV